MSAFARPFFFLLLRCRKMPEQRPSSQIRVSVGGMRPLKLKLLMLSIQECKRNEAVYQWF
ncbi:hypothetical protein O9G_001634 [Rozella allomycis CSF55]|uniref:Uncharacterized protein n=1 Tax=Rozella allomycis (strain CSF55) TaxID=988480 RepID=A0A075ASP4_ROZAC|nr:hypothetical protein O9G_001634 [Rozella allomycis CSF55]|eukprot:EPZ33283.1 hypothetical protein O9G_001634 [Rozella allomycis CSF55]